MGRAYPFQTFQDWFTQQWVIWWGRKIDPNDYQWLIGPFGNLNGIGENFIYQLAEKENLRVERNSSGGLISSIELLSLSEEELYVLSKNVIDFYENTSQYKLEFSVKWNPLFKFFGILVKILFSSRINQLNIPTGNLKGESISSEIIQLFDSVTNKVKYTIWLRKIESSGQVIYSGIYGTCKIPSGASCIKAVFPLPKGNATVILAPEVGENGELILKSAGKKIGDPGFYFLLNDAKDRTWTQFIRTFKDQLTVRSDNQKISAEQSLTLWGLSVVKFNYEICKNLDIKNC